MPSHVKQHGAALLSAIFISAIAAILATAIAVQQRWLISGASHMMNRDRATAALQGVNLWAHAVLLDYAHDPKTVPTTKFVFGKRDFNGMTLSGKIINVQGRFNLNALHASANQPAFIRLVSAVMPNFSVRKSHAIAEAITAWQSAQSKDDYYARQSPAYRAAHAPLVKASELRMVQGVDQRLMLSLAPYVTAISAKAKVDVNAASVPVLMSLSKALTREKAISLMQCRKQHGMFYQLESVQRSCLDALHLKELPITVKSHYFLLVAKAVQGDVTTTLHTMLYLKQIKKKSDVQTLWQTVS